MQLQSDKSNLDEVKTQFRAREGYYRLIHSSDYSQRNHLAIGLNSGTNTSSTSNPSSEKSCIKISLVTINDSDPNVAAGLRQNQHLQSHNSNLVNSSPNRTTQRSKSISRERRICFNVGREIFVYDYSNIRIGPDTNNPLYKRFYKGPIPTCHDFNQATATSESLSLLVGFSHGQIQLIDLNGSDDQESCKEFNVDRLIDKTRVTCIKWLPNSPSLFLVAHASGQLYLYKDDLPCGPTAPTYQLYKQSDGVSIYTCKTKTTRNPIYKWSIGSLKRDFPSPSLLGSSSSLHSTENESYSLNEFVFSPCAKYLACVSQDGFLRVYCYDTMEMIGRARSYYGGLTCACWSPDGNYVITGGEDDLITVWSFVERRVVARGVGHKSWVSVVSFDSFYTHCDPKDNDADDLDDDDDADREVDYDDIDDDEIRSYDDLGTTRAKTNGSSPRAKNQNDSKFANSRQLIRQDSLKQNFSTNCPSIIDRTDGSRVTSYRFGSVGQDTLICLWDLNDDLLRQPMAKFRVSSTVSSALSDMNLTNSNLNSPFDRDASKPKPGAGNDQQRDIADGMRNQSSNNKVNCVEENSTPLQGFLSSKGTGFAKTFSLVGRRDKRHLSQRKSDKNQASKSNSASNRFNSGQLVEDPTKLLGSPICPKMGEVPMIEPTICKRISSNRLTSLIFCERGFVTSCQDGFVLSWARPNGPSRNGQFCLPVRD